MKWILIYVVITAAGGVSTGTPEFNTEKACRDAVDALEEWRGAIKPVCVAKGDDADVATTAPIPRASAPVVAKAPKATP